MRGAHPDVALLSTALGIIPAYAGSTCTATRPSSRPGDHPRVCGEHLDIICEDHEVEGSSPRMRGALPYVQRMKITAGIIPAYAGSTVCSSSRLSAARDHPRVCGEHLPLQPSRGDWIGSSPRMRGAPNTYFGSIKVSRIIPAYAGSTAKWLPCGARSKDHPRVCGEHSHIAGKILILKGSSPRMRGARFWFYRVTPFRGIIPAYAGSTDYGLWLAGGW